MGAMEHRVRSFIRWLLRAHSGLAATELLGRLTQALELNGEVVGAAAFERFANKVIREPKSISQKLNNKLHNSS